MDKRLEPDAEIASNCGKTPALHSEEDVAITALAQAPNGGSGQRSAESLTPMLRRHEQVAKLPTARKIEAGCRRIVDSADGADPSG